MLSWARIATLIVFFGIAVIALFAIIDRARIGKPSATFAPDGPASNNRFVVTQAPPTSPLRRGDRIEITDPRTLAAYEYHALAGGSTLSVRRISPLPTAVLAEPLVPAGAYSAFAPVVIAIEAMFIGIAALIAARGRTNGSLSLAWFFALLVLLFNPVTPAWPGWVILAYAIAQGAIAAVAFLCATDFATRFAGDPHARWARRLRRISVGIGVVASVTCVAVSTDSFLAATTPVAIASAPSALLMLQAVCFLVGLALAFVRAPSGERQRVSWVAASLSVGIVGLVAVIFAEAAGLATVFRDYSLLLVLAMPVGCAYAMLRYRLLDIAFVINRATVFGVTSLFVLAALALVDYGLQTLLGSWLVHTGLSVQLGLALAIGIATRPLHERIDRVVDDLFFRRRHEAERELRQFAREVAYFDDTNVVLERTVQTVAHAGSLRCALLLTTPEGLRTVATRGGADASGGGGGGIVVDRNDGAVVRLLATRGPVDLHDVGTALIGDYAFPMFARNRLIGALVCGDKLDGVAAYAPDELEAIGTAAHACGLALDLLRIEALEREVGALRSAAVPGMVRSI